jgi:hypothetical protein
MESTSYWYLVLFVFLLWSVWNSYVGVRTAFVVRRGLSRLWFLILPGLLYLVLFIATLGLGLSSMFEGEIAPDLEHPKKHRSDVLLFSYPGNWKIDKTDQEYNPDQNVFVQSFMENAVVRLMVYESENPVEEEMKASRGMYETDLQDFRETKTFQRLGSFEGTGFVYEGKNRNTPLIIRIFLSPMAGGIFLEVHEIWAREVESTLLPGIELIRSTLRIKD